MELSSEDSGQIECEVKTLFDSVRSRPAGLEVFSATRIREQAEGLVEVVEGARVSLECGVTSDPRTLDSLTIRWSFNNQTVDQHLLEYHGPGHLDISIPEAKKTHSGVYQCNATTSLDSVQSEPTKLVVRERTKLIVSPSSRSALEGEDITLVCSVEAAAAAEVSWYKDEKLYTSGNIIELKDITEEDSGDYMCSVQTELDQVDSPQVPVTVFKRTKVKSSSGEMERVLVGSNLTLTCEAEIDQRIPAGQLRWTWMRDQQTLKEEKSVSRTNLMLSNLSSNHSGGYICSLDTRLEHVERLVSDLKVSRALNFTNFPKSRTILEGESFDLDCEVVVDAGLKNSTVMSWYKDGTQVSSVRDISSGLSVLDATHSDTGNFSCLVENELEREIRNASLVVLGKTQVFLNLDSLELMEGEDLELSCSFKTESEVVEISWWRDRTLLLAGLQHELVLRSVNVSEEGQYRCVLETVLDQAEAGTSVTVYRRTDIITEFQDIEITSGSQTRISCSASVDPRLIQNSTTIFIKEKFLLQPQSEKVDFNNLKLDLEES